MSRAANQNSRFSFATDFVGEKQNDGESHRVAALR